MTGRDILCSSWFQKEPAAWIRLTVFRSHFISGDTNHQNKRIIIIFPDFFNSTFYSKNLLCIRRQCCKLDGMNYRKFRIPRGAEPQGPKMCDLSQSLFQHIHF